MLDDRIWFDHEATTAFAIRTKRDDPARPALYKSLTLFEHGYPDTAAMAIVLEPFLVDCDTDMTCVTYHILPGQQEEFADILEAAIADDPYANAPESEWTALIDAGKLMDDHFHIKRLIQEIRDGEYEGALIHIQNNAF